MRKKRLHLRLTSLASFAIFRIVLQATHVVLTMLVTYDYPISLTCFGFLKGPGVCRHRYSLLHK